MTVHLQYLILCAAFVSPAPPQASGQGLKWSTDLATAQREARESNRLVLIHFGGPWCEPCRRLEQQVFNQPGFGRDLTAKYVAVKVDPHEHPDLAEKYGIRAVPSDVVATPSGQLITRMESPTTVDAYCGTLNRLASTVQPTASVATNRATVPANGPEQRTAENSLDRYASYYNRGQGPSSESTPGNRSAAPQSRDATPAPTAKLVAAAREPRQGPKEYVNEMATQNKGAIGAQPNTPQPPQSKAPANPPIALDGFCPVTLVERREWHEGDEKWGAIHHGRTYLFVSEEAQQKFLANPDRFSPVFAGNDPVQRVEHDKIVPGKRQHGAFYKDRVYLFASEDSFLQFHRDPDRYLMEASRQARRR
ncbi:MAG TPA: DUF255 domain-containing protein [Pirellulales bacterium]|nr:DUF255 domain-containing protein [Pirellulales bacterium]